VLKQYFLPYLKDGLTTYGSENNIKKYKCLVYPE